MRPRTVMRLYQLAARTWLSAAALSLLLPESIRQGVWVPVHLTLAGAATSAISGAMQSFALSLTATPPPPSAAVWTQFGAVSAGAALIAVGYPSHHPAVVAAGGSCFVAAMALLGWFVLRAWRMALNRRHALPMWMYLAAIAAVLVGGTIGALIGTRVVRDPALWLGLRSAHMALNVLGFVSVTIAASLVTLLPTVLRVRMPAWHGASTAACLLVGSSLIAGGLAARADAVAMAGAIVFVAGVGGMVWLVARVLSAPRTWPVPVTAKHLVAGLGWFVVGTAWLALALADGAAGFAAFRQDYLALFVAGWIVQVLLGAWLYLLPMARPAHPDERRRQLAAVELGGTLQLACLNTGVALLALRAAGWVPPLAGSIGVGLALGGGGIALLKAWCFPILARAPVLTRRQLDVWGA